MRTSSRVELLKLRSANAARTPANRVIYLLLLGAISTTVCGPASAQFSPLMANADLSVGVAQRFTTQRPSELPQSVEQANSDEGIIASVRYHPFNWLGAALSYEQVSTQETTALNQTSEYQLKQVLASYLIHGHGRRLQPFAEFGAGALYFSPTKGSGSKRVAGVFNIGVDIPLPNPHIGITLQNRSLWYHAIGSQAGENPLWTGTFEPAATAYLRF